jgi:hypothetical protein
MKNGQRKRKDEEKIGDARRFIMENVGNGDY